MATGVLLPCGVPVVGEDANKKLFCRMRISK